MKYFLINNTNRKTCNDLYAAHLNLVNKVEEADAILVIGGDGSLLHAIAKYQELDKPFIGVHGGTRGYLMNQLKKINVSNWVQALFSAAIFALYHTAFDKLSAHLSETTRLILQRAGALFHATDSFAKDYSGKEEGEISLGYHDPLELLEKND